MVYEDGGQGIPNTTNMPYDVCNDLYILHPNNLIALKNIFYYYDFDNNFYNKYNTYNVIDLNNVCNDINGNIINLNEVCKDVLNRIYIFTKENTKLVYIGVISSAHIMVDDSMANINHYT